VCYYNLFCEDAGKIVGSFRVSSTNGLSMTTSEFYEIFRK